MALRKLHRQEAPNSVGGRKSMYQIKATVAKRLDMIATAAAGHAIYIYIYIYIEDHKIIIQQLPVCILEKPMQRVFKILLQEPLQEAFNRISTRSSQKDLDEIVEGHLKDATRTSSRASHKDLYKLYKVMQRPWQHATRISTSFAQGHVKKPWARSSCQDPKESHKIVIKDLLLLERGLTWFW